MATYFYGFCVGAYEDYCEIFFYSHAKYSQENFRAIAIAAIEDTKSWHKMTSFYLGDIVDSAIKFIEDNYDLICVNKLVENSDNLIDLDELD